MEAADHCCAAETLLIPEIATFINLKKAQLLEGSTSGQSVIWKSDIESFQGTVVQGSGLAFADCGQKVEQVHEIRDRDRSNREIKGSLMVGKLEKECLFLQGGSEQQTVHVEEDCADESEEGKRSKEKNAGISCEEIEHRRDDGMKEHISGNLVGSISSKRRPLQYCREELFAMQGFRKDLGFREQVVTQIGPILDELNELKVADIRESSHCRAGNRHHHRHRNEAPVSATKSGIPDVIWDAALDKSCEQAYEVISTEAENQSRDDVSKLDDSQDSEDDTESFQQRAFVVSGEPDFDSGPPEDGLEYLRRVRWEAAQCPKIKVAKIAPEKLTRHQTHYLPDIPEIPGCDANLLPSKEWEREFLSDFSKLRTNLLNLSQQSGCALESLPHFRNENAWKVFCLGSASFEEESATKDGVEEFSESCMSESDFAAEDENAEPRQILCCSPQDEVVMGHSPLLSVMKSMDEVSRAALLRYHVSWLDDVEGLPENRAVWLFALAVAVDKPLDAQTSAAFRTLLRRCATIRARKLSQNDKELHMLNVLITISGQFFGQADNLSGDAKAISMLEC
ncbi:hypothetical protein O6H91_02G006800 [Diphasiastrum complanatum]|uniref:Uncharacterized protein n=1 Tax=Diphasiastrum complanatum TaxID=34168 RepID=A0ACC2ECN1_DIPCM|nr:hypothetical protein O6H91_02G006800 [Diphasiastrum complanatum]